MTILREPLLWYVVFALMSLLITFVLFRFLKSSARIKRKEYLFSGGIAGFLSIFFIAWYTFYPALRVPVGQVAPTSVPASYEIYSEPAFAIAIPSHLEPRQQKEVEFYNQNQEETFSFRIRVIENVPLERFASFKAEDLYSEMQQGMNKLMPAFKIVGPMQDAPFQGRRGYILPVEVTIPDDPFFKEERGTSARAVFQIILDDESRRIFWISYDDNEAARKMMSTFNLPSH